MDTNIFFQHKDLHSLVKIINEELEHLTTWFQSNRLSLNVKKTNFIIFRNSRKLLHGNDSVDILINGIKIERVRYVKFLGVAYI